MAQSQTNILFKKKYSLPLLHKTTNLQVTKFLFSRLNRKKAQKVALAGSLTMFTVEFSPPKNIQREVQRSGQSVRGTPDRETRRQVKAHTHFKRSGQVPPLASHRPPDLVP